jgi:hypothetical protein
MQVRQKRTTPRNDRERLQQAKARKKLSMARGLPPSLKEEHTVSPDPVETITKVFAATTAQEFFSYSNEHRASPDKRTPVLVNDSRATPLGKGRCKSVVVA